MKPKVLAFILVTFALAIIPLSVTASHSWGNYHWARTSNPFTLTLIDNVPSSWDEHLATASNDWSLSTLLDTSILPGNTKDKCNQPASGRIKVCAAKYGRNGWLGIAQIWVDTQGHITAGATKMNDTYFSTATYNKPEWRQFVMCQEIGHTFGLDHQDETFDNANLGSCMDYTNNPAGPLSNEHPNLHDYEQLELIYAHLDGTTTIAATAGTPGAAGAATGEDGESWGTAVRADAKGRPNLFVKHEHGVKKITWVYWAD